MTGWKTAAVATALWGVTGLGSAVSTGTMQAQDLNNRAFQLLNDSSEWLAAVQNFNFADGSSQIGVSIRDVDEKDATKAKGTATGVVVEEVETDSPAQKAGLKAGDIVTEFDGERVRSTRQFVRLVQETPTGRQVSLSVMRDGQRVSVSVQPREGGTRGVFKYYNIPTPKAPPLKFDGDVFSPQIQKLIGGAGRLGISIEDLSSQLADYFGTKDGVLVTAVTDNSNASRAGLKAGDVITSLNGQNITGAGDLRTRTQRLDAGDEFSVGIVRDKKPMTLKGKIDQPQQRRPTVKAII
jgi:serine protease Do